MGYLFGYMKPYFKMAIFAPLFMLLEVAMDVTQPKMMALIINQGVEPMNFAKILQYGVWMIVILLIGLAAGVLCNAFASVVSQNVGADLRQDLFSRVQTFTFRELDRFSTGTLITRMTNDVTQVQNFVQSAQQMMVRAPGLALGGLIMALTLNLSLGWIVGLAMITLSVFLFFLLRFSYPLFSQVQARLDDVNVVVQENLAGMRAIKAFVRRTFEMMRFGQVNERYTNIAIKAARVMALNMPVLTLIMNSSILIALWFGGHEVWQHTMPIGNFVAYLNYVTQILSSLLMFSVILTNIAQAKVSADRIQAVLQTEGSENVVADEATDATLFGAIEADHLSFSYGENIDHELVLRDLSFRIEPGEQVAIIGSTGSGKSSFLQLLPRLYEATRGELRVDGEAISSIPLSLLRTKIGIVLQETILFRGSIRDNIAFGRPDATMDDVTRAAKIAQAHDFITRLPDGYATRIGQRGVTLSGGQKQRLAIARALLVNPSILLFDGSTSALDFKTEKLLLQALREEKQAVTTIMVAERIASIRDKEKILVLDDGQIVGEGTHEHLVATCSVYRDIYASQMGISIEDIEKEVV